MMASTSTSLHKISLVCSPWIGEFGSSSSPVSSPLPPPNCDGTDASDSFIGLRSRFNNKLRNVVDDGGGIRSDDDGNVASNGSKSTLQSGNDNSNDNTFTKPHNGVIDSVVGLKNGLKNGLNNGHGSKNTVSIKVSWFDGTNVDDVRTTITSSLNTSLNTSTNSTNMNNERVEWKIVGEDGEVSGWYKSSGSGRSKLVRLLQPTTTQTSTTTNTCTIITQKGSRIILENSHRNIPPYVQICRRYSLNSTLSALPSDHTVDSKHSKKEESWS